MKGFYWWKCKFINDTSGIRLLGCSKLAINQKTDNDVITCRHDIILNFFVVAIFLLSSIVTGSTFMSISLLVLELWQFSFMRDWPEIRNLEITPSEFFPISEDWGELGLPNLAWMSVMKCYWMLQNSRVTAATVSELLRENQLGDNYGQKRLNESLCWYFDVRIFSYLLFFICLIYFSDNCLSV